ncbi:MAG: DUF2199 domain-containing protein [Rhizobiaceae bacterium]
MHPDSYKWTCACCGKAMTGLPMDLAFGEPGGWNGLSEEVRERSSLSDDFCYIDHGEGVVNRFIRCLLPFSVVGLDEAFRFGVWMSVSEASWNVYDKGFDAGIYELDGCFGYLGHTVPDFPDSYLLHADVYFREGKDRPLVELHNADHALVHAQCEGVPMAQVERWVAASMRH